MQIKDKDCYWQIQRQILLSQEKTNQPKIKHLTLMKQTSEWTKLKWRKVMDVTFNLPVISSTAKVNIARNLTKRKT